MPDGFHGDHAAHIDPAFRAEFRDWARLRAFLAARLPAPAFDTNQALRRLLHTDLAHRLAAARDYGWVLRGSLALPARPPADLPLPEPVRQRAAGTGIHPAHLSARPADDLDLCATRIPDAVGAPPREAARIHADRMADTIKTVVAVGPEPRRGPGLGLGGLVRYRTAAIQRYDSGQVVAEVTATPVDRNQDGERTLLKVDLTPPGAAPFDGPPEPAHRSTLAVDVPGFAAHRPDLYPTVNQLADKLCTIGVPRERPPVSYHRYKDLFDIQYLASTCQVDGTELDRAVRAHPRLAGHDRDDLPDPYLPYGYRPGPRELEVPWQGGCERERDKHPSLRDYPEVDEMVADAGRFVAGWREHGRDGVWLPTRGWVTRAAGPILAQVDRTLEQAERLAENHPPDRVPRQVDRAGPREHPRLRDGPSRFR